MTKQHAKKVAYGIAYRFVQQAIETGGDEAQADTEDQAKIDAALDEIAQMLFNRSTLGTSDASGSSQ